MMIMKQYLSVLLSFLVVFQLYYPPRATLAESRAGSPAASSADSSPTDILGILRKAGGFTTLIRLLKTTQMGNSINSQLLNPNSGLTLFAPNDNSFSNLKPGFFNSLNDTQKDQLVQFHMLPTFVSPSNFDSLNNPVMTQAGDDPTGFGLNVTTDSDSTTQAVSVNITTGVVNATVLRTLYTDNRQLGVYQVDKVLLPLDFFPGAANHDHPPSSTHLSPAPAPVDISANTKTNDHEEPAAPLHDAAASANFSLEISKKAILGFALFALAVAIS